MLQAVGLQLSDIYLRMVLDGPVPGLLPGDFAANDIAGNPQVALAVTLDGPGTFFLEFPGSLAPPLSPAYTPWVYSGSALATPNGPYSLP